MSSSSNAPTPEPEGSAQPLESESLKEEKKKKAAELKAWKALKASKIAALRANIHGEALKLAEEVKM